MATKKAYIIRNIVAAPFVLLLWYYGLSNLWCYQWIAQDMLLKNVAFIRQHSDATTDQRWDFKLGATYQYLQFLKANTPPDAVILYPTHDAFFPKGVESIFKGTEPHNKVLATRFLYPRKLILRNEFNGSPYAGLITHVAIVNGVGYDVLPQEQLPAKRLDFTVIEIAHR